MNTKLVVAAIFLLSIQSSLAQETPSKTAIHSIDLQNQKAEEKTFLENQLKENKKALNEQEQIVKNQKRDERKIVKKQNQLENEQNDFDRKQRKFTAAEKSVSKNENKLFNAKRDFDKMQSKFEKVKSKGKLSAVEIEKKNVKVSKQQLKIVRIEEDILEDKEKLSKLR